MPFGPDRSSLANACPWDRADPDWAIPTRQDRPELVNVPGAGQA